MASEALNQLQVKTDAAERGVKLGHTFLERTRLEENYQNILQVVENSRKESGVRPVGKTLTGT